jgi:hypothetical protein
VASSILSSALANQANGGPVRDSAGRLYVFYRQTDYIYCTRSDNNGKSWNAAVKVSNTVMHATGSFQASISAYTGYLYLLCVHNTGPAMVLYFSSDQGATWTSAGAIATADDSKFTNCAFALAYDQATDEDIYMAVWRGTSDKLMFAKSTDFGSTWSAPAYLSNNVANASFALRSDGRRFYATLIRTTGTHVYWHVYDGGAWSSGVLVKSGIVDSGYIGMCSGPRESHVGITDDGWPTVYRIDHVSGEVKTLDMGSLAACNVMGLTRVKDSGRVYIFLYDATVPSLFYRYLATSDAVNDTDTTIYSTREIVAVRAPNESDNIDVPFTFLAVPQAPDPSYRVMFDVIDTVKLEGARVLYDILHDEYRYRRLPRGRMEASSATVVYYAIEPTWTINASDPYADATNNDIVIINDLAGNYDNTGLGQTGCQASAQVEIIVKTDESEAHRRDMCAEIKRIIQRHGVDPYQDRFRLTIEEEEALDPTMVKYYGRRYRVTLKYIMDITEYDTEVYV